MTFVPLITVTGRVPIEGNGAYAMSKHGLVAFSDTLRLEMRKWGVHVALIEPTGFSTGEFASCSCIRAA